jgi:hypothetical protein
MRALTTGGRMTLRSQVAALSLPPNGSVKRWHIWLGGRSVRAVRKLPPHCRRGFAAGICLRSTNVIRRPSSSM